MKGILFCFFVILFVKHSMANCPTTDIILQNQSDVDSFKIKYSDCKDFPFNLIINGKIKNLDGLNQLKSISGFLQITLADSLINFRGLDSLKYIGSHLLITYVINLNSMDGLDGLQEIGGGLSIRSNWNGLNLNGPRNLKGLNNLKKIGIFLQIEDNEHLESLEGLNNLELITGDLRIAFNTNLLTLKGLNKLTEIGGTMNIFGNQNIKDLNGLEKLIRIKGDLVILGNDVLTNLDPLINLKSMNGKLQINLNPTLINLSGLASLNYKGISELIIIDNIKLSECNTKPICDFLSINRDSISQIAHNYKGCNTVEEILSQCNLVGTMDTHLDPEVNLFPNPATDEMYYYSGNKNEKFNRFVIYNMHGQTMQKTTLATPVEKIKVTVSDLPSGIYLLRIDYIDGSKGQVKFVKG